MTTRAGGFCVEDLLPAIGRLLVKESFRRRRRWNRQLIEVQRGELFRDAIRIVALSAAVRDNSRWRRIAPPRDDDRIDASSDPPVWRILTRHWNFNVPGIPSEAWLAPFRINVSSEPESLGSIGF